MQRERLYTEAQYTETHASFTLLDLKNTPSESSVTINILPLDEEKGKEDEEEEEDDEDLEEEDGEEEISSYEEEEQVQPSLPHASFESFRRENQNSKIIHKAARFIYSSEFNDPTQREMKKIAYINSDFYADHKSTDQLDIVDYYERYSPTTAKALINTLLLSRKEICKQCANFQDSPVYTDRLIYRKKNLSAREMSMTQFENTVNYKTSLPLSNYQHQSRDYMPIFNLPKTNASGIFYYPAPLDVFDLKTSLEPDIILENSEFTGIVNTHVYHRYEGNYSRISIKNFPTNFETILGKTNNFEGDFNRFVNYHYQVKMRNTGGNSIIRGSQSFRESQPTRTSLLLLEPLIFMPNFPQGKCNFSKSPISNADSLTLAKIVIVYTLAFFIVTMITFYIVYFT